MTMDAAWRNQLSLAGRRVHMTGIGGVGMAGLALLLKSRGHHVTGCDAGGGPLMAWLSSQGIENTLGHDPVHMAREKPDVIVRSPAVALDHPELAAARAAGIPIVDRGEALPFVLASYQLAAVAGTHGKTTTASMLAWIMTCTGAPASFCIGGVCPNLGAVAGAHPAGVMVVEADESDGTLKHYAADVAVITNMDLDHVDYFHDERAQVEVYGQFARRARHVVWSYADPVAQKLSASFASHDSFGLDPSASVSASAISLRADGASFQLHLQGRAAALIELGVPGHHNVLNALAATAAALRWHVSLEVIQSALRSFRLPGRRFETVYEGRGRRVISDYAHHPVEIAALLNQAKLLKPRRMIAVFQPHRYSRTAAFKKEFARVLSSLDYLVLAPVYAASEPLVPGGTSDDLHAACREAGIAPLALANSLDEAWQHLRAASEDGDLVLIIGAGDVEKIGTWASDYWSNML